MVWSLRSSVLQVLTSLHARTLIEPENAYHDLRSSHLLSAFGSLGLTTLALTRILQLLERTRVTVADCLRELTSSTPTLKKFRNSPLYTALALEKFSFRLLTLHTIRVN